jgi:hypothetical protein
MEVEDFYQERTKPLLFRSIDLISKPKSFSKRLDCAKTGESYAKELNQVLKAMYNNTFSHRSSSFFDS